MARSWFTDNPYAPPEAGGFTGGQTPQDPNAEAIRKAYRQFLGREPSDAEIQSHLGPGANVNASIGNIAQSPEAQAYASRGGQTTLGASMAAPSSATPYGAEDVMKADPGFKFGLNSGLQAIQRRAAAQGTLLTGGTMKDLTSWAQNYTSNEYSKIFDRYSSMADRALTAAEALAKTTWGEPGKAGSSYATNTANLTMGIGNVRAAGQVASANAWGGALGDIGNTAANLSLYNAMNPQQPKIPKSPSLPATGNALLGSVGTPESWYNKWLGQ